MGRKLEQHRVRGALDRFGPPFETGGGKVLDSADHESSAHPKAPLRVKRPYVRVGASSTTSRVRHAAVG